MTTPLLRIQHLDVRFRTRAGEARVLDDLGLELHRGETLGLVGESGCGKSMTALAVMGLIPNPPGRVAGGEIVLDGEDLLTLPAARLREIRGNRMAMIFQEPMTSLNPVYSVGEQITETLRLHQGLSRRAALERAAELLRLVHIPAPRERLGEYPHQLSGGMRQRVMIAMALACDPALLIADEPTTALDVTVQAQIFDLLQEIQETTGTAIVLITHDMGVIHELTRRVVVMYAGRKLEEGPTAAILDAPAHPYTRGLIRCVPHLELDPGPERPMLAEIPGMVPSLSELGEGCPFAPRCEYAVAHCREAMPPPFPVGEGHHAACWLLEEAG